MPKHRVASLTLALSESGHISFKRSIIFLGFHGVRGEVQNHQRRQLLQVLCHPPPHCLGADSWEVFLTNFLILEKQNKTNHNTTKQQKHILET